MCVECVCVVNLFDSHLCMHEERYDVIVPPSADEFLWAVDTTIRLFAMISGAPAR